MYLLPKNYLFQHISFKIQQWSQNKFSPNVIHAHFYKPSLFPRIYFNRLPLQQIPRETTSPK
jgi:hypothetical protein